MVWEKAACRWLGGGSAPLRRVVCTALTARTHRGAHGFGNILVEAFGWMDDSDARIGGRMAHALVFPDVQVIQRIDDAAAKLVIDGPGAIGAMLFEGAAGKAEIARCFGCA